jgi:hypothetical protein
MYTLTYKIKWLHEHIDRFDGYMVNLIQTCKRLVELERIESIGHNSLKFIDDAFWKFH